MGQNEKEKSRVVAGTGVEDMLVMVVDGNGGAGGGGGDGNPGGTKVAAGGDAHHSADDARDKWGELGMVNRGTVHHLRIEVRSTISGGRISKISTRCETQ